MTKTNQSKHNLILVTIVGIIAIIALFLISTTTNLKTNTDLTGQAYASNEDWVSPCDNDCEEQYEFDVVLESFGKEDLANQAFICADKYSEKLEEFNPCIVDLEKQSLAEGINPLTWKSDAMGFICSKIKYTEANQKFITTYCK